MGDCPAGPLTPELLDGMDVWAEGKPDREKYLCNPANNRNAAAYFITRFCRTLDEERAGAVEPIRDWQFSLDLIDFIEELRLDPSNGLVRKSRRMLGTWVTCAYMIWRAQWTKGFPAFATTGKGADYVDDGGDHSTPKSLFGRMRFIYDRIPEHIRPHHMDFAFKRAVCVETDAYVSGEAPTEQAGRSGGYVFAYVDECAFVENSEALHRALDPACKTGRVYMSTPNGTANTFARIIKTRPPGWRIHTLDWTRHPELAEGLTDTPEAEVERYGPRVSPKFRAVTASLTDEDIAQEYNHSLERSARGLVYREFNEMAHVSPEVAMRWDEELPSAFGLDYGGTGFTASVIGQIVGDPGDARELRVMAAYELEGGDGPTNARELWRTMQASGFTGEPGSIALVGDPAGEQHEQGSGRRVVDYFVDFGFTDRRQPFIRGPGSVERGISCVRVALRAGRIRISARARPLIDRFPEYRWPVERATGMVRDTKPLHNDASHVMDAFRYLCAWAFGARYGAAMKPGSLGPVVPAAKDRLRDRLEIAPDSWKRTMVGARKRY